MSIVQQAAVAAGASSGTSLTTFDVALGATATAGNVLVAACAADKTVGVWTTPSGWTVLVERVGNSASQAVYYRVSDGTETSVTFAWSSAIRFAGGYIREESGVTATGALTATANSGESSVTSLASGAVTAAGDGVAIAALAIDSASAFGGISGNATWNNAFIQDRGQSDTGGVPPDPTDPGFPGWGVASRSVSAGSVSVTPSWTNGDQAVIALLVLPASGAAYNEAGQGTLISVGAGADALAVAEAGQGALSAQASASDALAVGETGTGIVAALGGVGDRVAATETGQGFIAARGAALDQARVTDAAASTLAATAGGSDAASFAESGQSVSAATAAGLDQWHMADAGAGRIGLAGAGADTFSGGTVWDETGGATTSAQGASSDALRMVAVGGGLLAMRGGGLDMWGGPPGMPGPGVVVARPLVGRTTSVARAGQVAPVVRLTGQTASDGFVGRVASGALRGTVTRED